MVHSCSWIQRLVAPTVLSNQWSTHAIGYRGLLLQLYYITNGALMPLDTEACSSESVLQYTEYSIDIVQHITKIRILGRTQWKAESVSSDTDSGLGRGLIKGLVGLHAGVVSKDPSSNNSKKGAQDPKGLCGYSGAEECSHKTWRCVPFLSLKYA